MNFNLEKRLKKFNKEMFLFKNHPNYEDVKELYINGEIKNINSAEKKLINIRITKKGNVYKNNIVNQQKLIKQKEEFEKIRKDNYFKKLEQKMIKLKNNKISHVVIKFNEFRFININMREFVNKFINIVNRTNPLEKLLIKIDDLYYTLNDKTKKSLFDYVKDNVQTDNILINMSDVEYIANLQQRKKMIVSKINKVATYNKSSGEFFRFLNKTDIDLSDYQIYNKEQFNKVIHDESCLYFSLKILGLECKKLCELKLFVKNRNIPICDIKKICDKLQIQINVKKICSDRHRVFNFGKEYNEVYNVGLIEEHYFCIKETKYTSYSINNYNKIKHINNFNNIINDKNERKNRFIDSFDLINLFIKNKEELLESMTLDNCNIANTQFYDKIDDTILNLDYNKNTCCRSATEKEKENESLKLEILRIKEENNAKRNKMTKKEIEKLNDYQNKFNFQTVFFDFETYRDEHNIHKPYMLCTESDFDEFDTNIINESKYINGDELLNIELCKQTKQSIKNYFIGKNCARDFLKSLKFNTILIAHNVTYDYRFIIDELYDVKEISRGSKLLGCSAKIKNYYGKVINIKIKDSYHLIGQPLRNFNKIFNLEIKKEVMPYDLYNEENINKRFVKIDECLKFVKKEDKNDFINNLKIWDLLNNSNEVDIIKYSRKYCEIDVDVLRNGYNIFKRWMLNHFNINTNDCLTIASLSHKYLIQSGCYDDVYELGGVPQMFIQGCVVGGRTMTNNNEKQIFNLENDNNKKMQDFDAVSLYPSAMKRMKGFLKGKPKILKDLTYDFIKNQDGYFIEILIKKIGINRDFSLMSYKTEEGIRLFTNDMINKIIKVDKITLEDLIEFQNIEFDIIRGYYFNEGFNNKINKTIEYIFNKRLELKKNNNPAELTYKLIMNNAYGKSIMKPIENEIKLFTDKKNFEVYIERNYNWISSFNKFGKEDDKYKVNVVKKLDDHFNICHVGVEILSMSKRIMNEVMNIAENNNIKIYYQDTDSMHIEEQDIKKLQLKYNEKYNRELIGGNLGQFHSDFNLKGCNYVYACKSIFLGKKSYIDELKGIDEKGNIKTGYHIRMKGIPNSCIEYTSNKLGLKTPFQLYEKLLTGEEVTFDLTEGGTKTNLFEFTKNYQVFTKTDFKRNIKF